MLPSIILFGASDAIETTREILLVDEYSCPEFHRWWQVRSSRTAVDLKFYG
jgi:hypothetical protein